MVAETATVLVDLQSEDVGSGQGDSADHSDDIAAFAPPPIFDGNYDDFDFEIEPFELHDQDEAYV